MAREQKTYETTFIVNAGLDDPQIDALIEKVKEVITKNGGNLQEIAKWGRKRFAYPIKKKNNGFYVVCEFTGPGDVVGKLERHYQLDENILRFLSIVIDKRELAGRISSSDLLKQQSPQQSTSPPSPLPPPPATPPPSPAAVMPTPATAAEDDDKDKA